ncbi:MAG: sigma-54 dependent transcriptional regulator [Terracidiphilus sp.]|jgi:two-component system response regulator AtoC
MPSTLEQSHRIDPAELPGEAVIFGRTAAMREVQATIERVLNNDLPVLIRGESGTGKEVTAKYLHTRSDRRDAPFVKVNCAAVPVGLLESELLGYEKGSFSGASETRLGLIEIAEGGTLFLDEIGDMDWALQTKLLHLLQDGRYARIGGREELQANIRVICSTNIDLEAAVESRAFRQDLFYRIDVIRIQLVPLRERIEDIPQLCDYFLQRLAKRYSKPTPQLTSAAVSLLKQWNWPGNLRELESWMERNVILGGEEALTEELSRQMTVANAISSLQPRIGHLQEVSRHAASAAAREVILKVLQANHWNRRKTAEELNISYRSLLDKLQDVAEPRQRKSRRDLPPKR